jgi:hypothetical protein
LPVATCSLYLTFAFIKNLVAEPCETQKIKNFLKYGVRAHLVLVMRRRNKERRRGPA